MASTTARRRTVKHKQPSPHVAGGGWERGASEEARRVVEDALEAVAREGARAMLMAALAGR